MLRFPVTTPRTPVTGSVTLGSTTALTPQDPDLIVAQVTVGQPHDSIGGTPQLTTLPRGSWGLSERVGV